ncbi:MAG: small multi-drug export protein [Candidatus Cloacimonetes bacterium]|nr:small multi-drug export protein [Candidatus Cloacimonadota bacterium]
MQNYIKKLMIALLCAGLVLPLFGNAIADKTVSWLATMGFSPRLIVLIISMLPIIELRGSIPVAILLFQIPWPEAVLLSVIGNMIPIPFVLLLMDWFFALLSKSRAGARFTEWLFARTRRKGKSIEKYEEIGLALFVGIPLPGTGGWTGAFAANIFGLKFWKSLLFILFGVLIAAGIVTPLTLMGKMAIN